MRVQSKIGQVLRQLPIFTLSTDVFTATISEQPKGHSGLNSKAEEEGNGEGKLADFSHSY